MTDPSDGSQARLHERITRQGEETITKLATELLENPLVNGAISRAFEAREKAAQAQEAALGALQLPTAADMERLTRRVRSVSQRLEGIEDSLDRLDERLASTGLGGIEERLDAVTERLEAIEAKLPEPKPSRRTGRQPGAFKAAAPSRSSPSCSASSAIRSRAGRMRSLTSSTAAAAAPRAAATPNRAAHSISTASAPRAAQASST